MSVEDADLLAMQAPLGVPRSNFFETVTDPLIPSNQRDQMLAHFYPAIYDLDPSSHLSRLLNVLLGDAGAGQLRKQYTYNHLSSVLLTTHYNDLDLLYGAVFGLKRFIREQIDVDQYNQAHTDAEWEAIDAADASYRARIEQFSHSLAMAGTPTGLVMAANAVLGAECRLYESYAFKDDADIYAPSTNPNDQHYGDLETKFKTWGNLDHHNYGSLEGTDVFRGRANGGRSEFILRPMRSITNEERFHLTRVIERLQPTEAMLTIDDRPLELHTKVPVFRATASSTYWHVQPKVQPSIETAQYYDNVVDGQAVEQPRLPFSKYQGEVWTYNADVVKVSASAEDADGNVLMETNYERRSTLDGRTVDYTPELALGNPTDILLGRAVSDGVLAASVVDRG